MTGTPVPAIPVPEVSRASCIEGEARQWPRQSAARYGVKTEPGTNARPGAEVLAELAALIADGHLEVPIADVYPLTQVRQAYTELERRHTHGKIVLRP
ncbi:zinc-binding dehydrogenase [Nonomuraea sp. NPDC003804]|uniref:zinc-binding dehydrogenase n=1 Tax=Nonomuraea sp. NPDC003804 TaxID=3154547 RepID=UPI0033B2E0A5